MSYKFEITTDKEGKFRFHILSFLALLTASLFILGCSSQSAAMKAAVKDAKDPETAKAFEKWFYSVVDDIKNDPSYKRIPLDSQKRQEWFLTELFLAWDKKITKEQFIEKGLEKYPDYSKSLEFVAKRLP